MKGSVVALGEVNGRRAAAWMVDGKMQDFLIDPASDAPAPGSVFRAICDRPMKGQGGMMLRLAHGLTGYLRGAKGLAPGQAILVMVTGFADDGKAVPVTQRVLFKSKYAIVTPEAPGTNISRAIRDEERRVVLQEIAAAEMEGAPETTGLIVRSVAAGGNEADIAEDIAAMRALSEAVMADVDGAAELLVGGADAHELAWREWGIPDQLADGEGAFDDHGVHEAIDDLIAARVSLEGGAFAFIEPTRALVAVDVNTGADTSFAAGLKANVTLARDLPRLLRLRGLGGMITVDLAPMAKKDRRQFEQVLKAAFKRDGTDTVLAGFTPLGCFELQRKRDRLPVARSLAE